MVDQPRTESRIHDLFGVFMGAIAAGILISTPWQVDTTGPDPFYKGPLIYPILALGIMMLSSLPSAWRLSQSKERARDYGLEDLMRALFRRVFILIGAPSS